ncbi:hypothetical protein ASC94_22900 [Massilia sp. Root418]|jgi:hypothetical protein|uniref:hypothetical protein n=1 Tax=Massilia sp. Root418 TaxID=1736532 RepID=UPI0006F8B57F|nr:hypothetical protein [Massilia sp. Root418]KQW89282.1 hypothetical protein ASC94_22900 [Massilia sp. Root418]
MTVAQIVGIAVLLVLLAGPAALGLAGWYTARRAPPAPGPRPGVGWRWRWTLMSALLYVLAFNLTFFIQELFLVLPKAFTPGLRPTLFHNNHLWQGDNPLASLFQGTGAIATLLAGGVCAWLLRRGAGKSAATRLFLFWMAYSGIFMALPQVVIGVLSTQSDLGMAMVYLGLSQAAKVAASVVALAVIPLIAGWLRQLLLGKVGDADRVATARGRNLLLLELAVVPALLALPAIFLFRIPRNWLEVAAVPVVVTIVGLVWMQAGAWRPGRATGRVSGSSAAAAPLAWPLGAVAGLLVVFQLLLRPGVRFY